MAAAFRSSCVGDVGSVRDPARDRALRVQLFELLPPPELRGNDMIPPDAPRGTRNEVAALANISTPSDPVYPPDPCVRSFQIANSFTGITTAVGTPQVFPWPSTASIVRAVPAALIPNMLSTTSPPPHATRRAEVLVRILRKSIWNPAEGVERGSCSAL